MLLALTAVSCALGLMSVSAASGSSLHDPAVQAALKRQALSLGFGMVALIVLMVTDYHVWTHWWKVLYGCAVGLLLAVMVVGHSALGSQRWIRVGPFDLQPSELSKLAVIVALTALLSVRVGKMRRMRDLLVPGLCAAVPAVLVVLQPDLGTGLVLGAILVGMVFAAGFSAWRLSLVVLVSIGAMVGLVVAHVHWPHQVPLPLHSYQLARLLAFVNPQAHAQSTGYQVLQSEMAVGSGRIAGNGVFSGGAGGQLAYMPEANSDFIFAVIGDTMGFIGSTAVLVTLCLIVWRVIACMATARDAVGALLAAGVACMLGFETLLNTGVTLGLMPVTGVPLPFTSYGGSAALVNLAAVGLVESIYRRRKRLRT